MHSSSNEAVLGIAGSLRGASFNRALLAAMAARAPAGLSIRVYADLATIPLFNEDHESGGGPAPVARLREEVARARGVLIATPEYNQSLPGVAKNLVDWLSRSEPEVLNGKPVGIVGASPGPWGTRLAQAALRQTLTACGALIMPVPQVYLRHAADAFDERGQLTDTRVDEQLRQFLAAFQKWTKR
jgi:chromate reductase, NAD(P)H dehydrogenase (quinone)